MPTDHDHSPVPAGDPLAALTAAMGEVRSAQGNEPLILNHPQTAWFVVSGALDVFMTETRDGTATSPAEHIIRLGPGRMAFGVREGETGIASRLSAKGLPGTRVRRMAIRDLLDAAVLQDERGGTVASLVAVVDAWIEDFGTALARPIVPRPPVHHRLPSSGRMQVEGLATAQRGVVWLAGAADATFLGTEPLGHEGPGLVPVTPGTWVAVPAPREIECRPSRTLGLDTLLLVALPEFHRLGLVAAALNRQLLLVDEANLQRTTASHRVREAQDARRRLLNLDRQKRLPEQTDVPPLLSALRAVAHHEGITINGLGEMTGEGLSLASVLKGSRVRARRIGLTRRRRWWLGDSGAMLAFRRRDGQPLALLPAALGYRIMDPVTGQSVPARGDRLAELDDYAWFLYRPLPRDEPIGIGAFFAVTRGHLAADLVRMVVAGTAAGLLLLVPAVAFGVLIDDVITAGDPADLLYFSMALVVLAFITGLLQMFRGTAFMRLEGRITTRLSAALWDRILRLPTGFFRRFAAGDVAERAMAFMALRDRIAGAVAEALLSVLFALPAIGLLFLYNNALGWLNLGVSAVVLIGTGIFGVAQLPPQRRYFTASRRLTSNLHQLIGGVAKLRTAQAEGAALAAWAHQYRRKKQAEIHTAVPAEHLTGFSAAVPALASALVFAVTLTQDGLSLADFLVVYAVSMVLYASLVKLGLAFQAVATIVPVCEQVLSILAAETEDAGSGCEPITLGGEIRFDRVSFRYSEDGPEILHEVSLHAKPSEFIAIVGESGAGKSTLLQLALGLERPATGGVYYDGRNLVHLDVTAVRRQIGVVVQDGALLTGDIRSNIIGEAPDLTLDDAWRAAHQAMVADDIAAMPMGMYTAVGDSTTTLSGGQSQRLRIAAAMVRNPRIVFLDEATSWLDVRSQAETMAGIERSAATRIVIAHRLSTIRRADRIYVMQAGRVVQTGRFDELSNTPGPFQDLARRQTL